MKRIERMVACGFPIHRRIHSRPFLDATFRYCFHLFHPFICHANGYLLTAYPLIRCAEGNPLTTHPLHKLPKQVPRIVRSG